MKVIQQASEFDQVRPGCVLTIGNFDGVHAGHQEILRVAREAARQRDTEVLVMTFEPHPVAVLYPEKAPKVLTPLDQKLNQLQPFADGCILVLEDNRELLGLSARDFVKDVLMERIQPSVIVEGHDFHFGAKRSGNVDTLRSLGQEFGFDVKIVSPFHITFTTDQSLRVSSTIIRYMLESGHVEDARQALRRPYRLLGKIESGRGKGREIGYPTLNMAKPDQVIPAEGVYAGFVSLATDVNGLSVAKKQRPAVFSIGQAQTFSDEIPMLIEAHLLDDDGHVSSEVWMGMDFISHLRKQHKYPSVEDLVTQIEADCEQALAILKQAS